MAVWTTRLRVKFATLSLAVIACYRESMASVVDTDHDSIEHIARLLVEQAEELLAHQDT